MQTSALGKGLQINALQPKPVGISFLETAGPRREAHAVGGLKT